jgi:exopolyphosphatase / guanosine-5'-triphosphate,3'-diphosphate pyrophosphatase
MSRNRGGFAKLLGTSLKPRKLWRRLKETREQADPMVAPERLAGVAPLTRVIGRRHAADETVAAVDLGSNSFHMIVARVVHGQLHVLDRLQETVRLGAGLDAKNRLTAEAGRRAIDCLKRFGQRLRGMQPDSVRVVGTNTLRRARRTEKFLARAQAALGHPIEIISGREEARLIYLGVAREIPEDGPRLVVDIGGGSTELILGERMEPKLAESLYMGCVSMWQSHFPDGRITAKAMRRAETAARLELQPVEAQFRNGWHAAYGSSGTIRSIGAVVRAAGWSEQDITPAALANLRETVLKCGHVGRLHLPGLNDDRAPVFPGGVAILTAVFDALGIERLRVSDSALREGLLYDLLGRLRHEDVRERTIGALSALYHVDKIQAARVETTARECFAQVAADWKLTDDDAALLSWAARLHEMGLAVAHTQYHKHGAYLVRYADLPGFSNTEQHWLALLIRAHRRKFPVGEFAVLPKEQQRQAQRLAMLLRLSVLLHRGRSDAALPRLRLRAGKRSLRVDFPSRWLAQHPLTLADLQQEEDCLGEAGLALRFD